MYKHLKFEPKNKVKNIVLEGCPSPNKNWSTRLSLSWPDQKKRKFTNFDKFDEKIFKLISESHFF